MVSISCKLKVNYILSLIYVLPKVQLAQSWVYTGEFLVLKPEAIGCSAVVRHLFLYKQCLSFQAIKR